MTDLLLPEAPAIWVPSTVQDLAQFDLTRIVHSPEDQASFLNDLNDRAAARVNRFEPVLPAERFEAFKRLNYHPHGVFIPSALELRDDLQKRLREMGEIPNHDQRLDKYIQLQAECEQWELAGIPGRWSGQQAIHRSTSRFRLIEYGRRAGKTFAVAREALAMAIHRPRFVVWLAGPTNTAVSRAYDMITELVNDLRIEWVTKRDTKDERLLILANGSRFEGVSLQNYQNAAGAAVDLALVDEAAQIEEEAWTRGVLPPLTDRAGQAILISSPEGDSSFMHRRAERAKKEHDLDWDVFRDASYEVNFYMFPQGRQSQSVKQAEKEMDPEDFLEQYTGVAQAAKNRIYPQFRESIHVAPCPYVPGIPVTVAIDPSGGANAYAVEVMQRIDGIDRWFDEYYESGVLAEDVMAALDERPWRKDVKDAIMDSAVPSEVERWVRNKWPAYGVVDKPQPKERFPFYRSQLRDPFVYHPFFEELKTRVMLSWGMRVEDYHSLPKEEQKKVLLEIEELLLEDRIATEDFERLAACSRIVFDPRCHNAIEEHKTYVYRKPRIANTDLTEEPRKFHDHALDAIGYYYWQHRFEIPGVAPQTVSSLRQASKGGPVADQTLEEQIEQGINDMKPFGFLATMRESHLPSTNYSYLQSTGRR